MLLKGTKSNYNSPVDMCFDVVVAVFQKIVDCFLDLLILGDG